MATLRVLMESSVEELKIVQTILLLVTSTDVVQGKSLAKVASEGGKEGGRERGGREGERGEGGRKGMVSQMRERERERMSEGEGGSETGRLSQMRWR